MDFYYRNEGTIIILIPETDRARQWVKRKVHIESWQSQDHIPIELRYFDNIYRGILSEGMTIERTK